MADVIYLKNCNETVRLTAKSRKTYSRSMLREEQYKRPKHVDIFDAKSFWQWRRSIEK